MSNPTILVLFGGCSSEHTVSLSSARAVLGALSRRGYPVLPVAITPKGAWFYYTAPFDAIGSGSWRTDAPSCLPCMPSLTRGEKYLYLQKGEKLSYDAVFPVLHGKNGEDGTIQGLFELIGAPLIGCGVLASALCMDKDRSHKVAAQAGVRVPESAVFRQKDDFRAIESSAEKLGYPLFVKPVRGGAKLLHLETVFIENSLGHFAAVCLFSFGLSFALSKIDFHKSAPASRAWREIDEAALCANASFLRQAAQCPLMAVVKADAYGHGAKTVARALQKNGVRFFAVACLSEGVSLRKAGIRGNILVLGYTAPDAAPLLRRWRLTQTITCVSYARKLSAQRRALRVHLALDTGMHRLGVDCHDLKAIAEICRLPHLKIQGTFSHLCASDGVSASEKAYTEMQLKNFYSAVEAMRQNGLDPGVVHMQASYGILSLPPQPCGLARPGIALYGLTSDGRPYRRSSSLKPVLAVRARVAAVRTLQAGERAGYGLAFTALRPTRLAVVAIGYADGLPRDFAARGGEILLNGQKAPVVGLLCMDQLFADVTEIGPVECGDIATLIGNDHTGQIRAEDVARQCGMITNELVSRLNARLPAVKAASKALP